jgi:hypothetical protein
VGLQNESLGFFVHDQAVEEVLNVLDVAANISSIPESPCDIGSGSNVR